MNKALLKLALCFGCALLAASGCQFIRSDNLNQAIVRGETDSVRKALSRGADVNGRGMHAMTPLMTASKAGRLDICELLVERGADVNGHNKSGSVLMWAVESGNEQLVRFLLKSGAVRSWTNALGGTAESLARHRGLTNVAALVKAQ
jgi:ankyrin repeat protein